MYNNIALVDTIFAWMYLVLVFPTGMMISGKPLMVDHIPPL